MQIRTRHAFAREAWIERRKSTVAGHSASFWPWLRWIFRDESREREKQGEALFISDEDKMYDTYNIAIISYLAVTEKAQKRDNCWKNSENVRKCFVWKLMSLMQAFSAMETYSRRLIWNASAINFTKPAFEVFFCFFLFFFINVQIEYSTAFKARHRWMLYVRHGRCIIFR